MEPRIQAKEGRREGGRRQEEDNKKTEAQPRGEEKTDKPEKLQKLYIYVGDARSSQSFAFTRFEFVGSA